jgi:hypothetical protein
MNPLYHHDKSIKFSKESIVNNPTFPYHCPEEFQYLCTMLSRNAGLCKRSAYDCEVDTITDSELLIHDTDSSDVITESELQNCGKVTLDSQQELGGETPLNISRKRERAAQQAKEAVLPTDILPVDTINENQPEEILENFSIMTYNISSNGYARELLDLKLQAIIEVIRKNNPSILCLQGDRGVTEMLRDYPYAYTSESSDVSVFSKYRPASVKMYSIAGIGSNNSFMTMEFKNVVIINCSLQQEHTNNNEQLVTGLYTSQCRRKQLKSIGLLLEAYALSGKACILLGSFSDVTGRLEIEELKAMKVSDVWKELRNEDDGYTRDTNINYTIQGDKRSVRSDLIFYRNPDDNRIITPILVKLTGRKPSVFDENTSDKEKRKLIALWPSDYFAVYAIFEVLDTTISLSGDAEEKINRESVIIQEKI